MTREKILRAALTKSSERAAFDITVKCLPSKGPCRSAPHRAITRASGRPLVPAFLVRAYPYNLFRIRCPYCGHTHTHGAGRPHDDTREYASHRLSHCTVRTEASERGYILVLQDGEPPNDRRHRSTAARR